MAPIARKRLKSGENVTSSHKKCTSLPPRWVYPKNQGMALRPDKKQFAVQENVKQNVLIKEHQLVALSAALLFRDRTERY